jgi:hypothetical protein
MEELKGGDLGKGCDVQTTAVRYFFLLLDSLPKSIVLFLIVVTTTERDRCKYCNCIIPRFAAPSSFLLHVSQATW